MTLPNAGELDVAAILLEGGPGHEVSLLLCDKLGVPWLESITSCTLVLILGEGSG